MLKVLLKTITRIIHVHLKRVAKGKGLRILQYNKNVLAHEYGKKVKMFME